MKPLGASLLAIRTSIKCNGAASVFFAAIAWTLLIAPATRGQEPVSEAQVADLMARLRSDRFLDRENAMAELISAGKPAVAGVAAAVKLGDRAVVARGMHVLRELSLSEEQETATAAEAALKLLASDATAGARRQARRALSVLESVRRKRALAHLLALGAKDLTAPDRFGWPLAEDIFALQIDQDWRGGINDLRQLAHLPDLQKLTLIGPQVNDAWLAAMGPMPNLRSLNLKRSSITNAGLAHLVGLQRLDRLGVFYASITDGCLEHLEKLANVALIQLYGTKVSREGAEQLERKLAVTKVDFKQGAFLGVGGIMNVLRCEISEVRAGSAAEKAGILVGDVIVAYEKQPVADFEALTAIIAKNVVGDKVEIEILRGGKTIKLEVSLGEGNWEQR